MDQNIFSMIGYIGLVIVFIAYLFLYLKKQKEFLLINSCGTFLFIIHSFLIKDIPFLALNSFILIILILALWEIKKQS